MFIILFRNPGPTEAWHVLGAGRHHRPFHYDSREAAERARDAYHAASTAGSSVTGAGVEYVVAQVDAPLWMAYEDRFAVGRVR